ncbi:tRNA intron endonuclease [Lipomyces tetrasporus]|uniref:tRNA-splicing endonuclease subunit Sen34 n=1 Tax=Lipomyces tetrasporus TaxID=54092 RepID=A0AAD7QQ09_9ASCO|nr:tRNA intron endonuclease [Lipomyces tetrasporus]KAJ8098856.1 tRNA intron endonuclease [Lipomyces tetrasporus]
MVDNDAADLISISFIDGEYFVFDIEAVKRLRNHHHVAGILVGTLPQVPQQSTFLGLPVQLMPEEAALLVQRGVARIIDEGSSHEVILAVDENDIDEATAKLKINELESTGSESQGQLVSFTTPAISTANRIALSESSVAAVYDTPRFDVYKYLHKRGYFISPGLRFGSQFLAYPGDPLRYHSHYLVRGLGYGEEFSLLELVGSGRLGTGVKKAWMVGGHVPDDDQHKLAALDSSKIIESEGDESIEDFVSFCVEWAGFG